jgi:hypothetical protein
VLHRYHHEHNNFFSHFIQYILEIGFPVVFLPVYYLYGSFILDEWILMFSALFYSSVHNINYGCFHVNDVHSLHHKNELTNIGPDLCDIMFGTKNSLNDTVENTNHYIFNIIILTIFMLCLKSFYLNETFKKIFDKFIFVFLISCLVISITFSTYFYFFHNKF